MTNNNFEQFITEAASSGDYAVDDAVDTVLNYYLRDRNADYGEVVLQFSDGNETAVKVFGSLSELMHEFFSQHGIPRTIDKIDSLCAYIADGDADEEAAASAIEYIRDYCYEEDGAPTLGYPELPCSKDEFFESPWEAREWLEENAPEQWDKEFSDYYDENTTGEYKYDMSLFNELDDFFGLDGYYEHEWFVGNQAGLPLIKGATYTRYDQWSPYHYIAGITAESLPDFDVFDISWWENDKDDTIIIEDISELENDDSSVAKVLKMMLENGVSPVSKRFDGLEEMARLALPAWGDLLDAGIPLQDILR